MKTDYQISINSIESHGNVRKKLTNLNELVESIRVQGLQIPILVYKNGEGYVVWDGHRRLEAAKRLEWSTIPAIVTEEVTSESSRIIRQLTAGASGEPLTDIEIAEAVKKLIDDGKTQVEIGKILGKSQTWVAQRLQILALPKPIQKKIVSRELSVTSALELQKAPHLVEKAANKPVSVIRQLIKGENQKVAATAEVRPKSPIIKERANLEDAVVNVLLEELTSYEIPMEKLIITAERVLKAVNIAKNS